MKTGIFCRQRRKARAKEVFMRKKRLWEKFVKLPGNEIFLIRDKGVFFAHAKLTDKEKLFLSAPRQQFPTAPKLTCSNPFWISLATVSLQYNNPFFENSQSCVSTKVTLSHRFKSSPAISGKFAIPGAAGYLMNAGHFRENHVSSGDLNRRSQDGVDSLKHGRLAHVRSQFSLFRRSPTHKNLPPATFCTSERAFWLLFARRKKWQFVLLCRKFRGFPNLKTAHHSHTSLICYSFTSNFKIRCKNKKTLLKYHHTGNPYSPGLCYTYVTLWKNHLQK